jgi:hypothetical protein
MPAAATSKEIQQFINRGALKRKEFPCTIEIQAMLACFSSASLDVRKCMVRISTLLFNVVLILLKREMIELSIPFYLLLLFAGGRTRL